MPLMPATVIQPLITNAGLNAAIAADGSGLQLQITHVQIGSAAYALNPAPGSADYNRTGLVTPTETIAVAGGHVMNGGFRVDAMFPAWAGAAYGATEIGFWAGVPGAGGILFAIWAQTTPFAQRNNIDYLASFAVGLARVPNGSVTVTFDPDYQKAIALMTFHEEAANPHPQYKRFFTLAGASVNTPIGVDRFGGVLVSVGTSPLSHSLPSFAGREPGEWIEVINNSTFPCTITAGPGQFFAVTGAALAPVVLLGGESARFVVPGAGAQWAVSGSATLKYSIGFEASLANPGWRRLPNGEIEQWGSVTTSASGGVAVTFPIAFPNACLNLTTGAGANAPGLVSFDSLTKNGFNIHGWTSNTGARMAMTSAWWKAKGH